MEKPECPCNSCNPRKWEECRDCKKYMPWRIKITKWMEEQKNVC